MRASVTCPGFAGSMVDSCPSAPSTRNIPSNSYIYEKYRQMKRQESNEDRKMAFVSPPVKEGRLTGPRLLRVFQVVVLLLSPLTPIFMLLIPRFCRVPSEFLVCQGDCLVSLFSCVFRIILMLPLCCVHYSTLGGCSTNTVKYCLSLHVTILFTGWVFYVVYVLDSTLTYQSVSNFVLYSPCSIPRCFTDLLNLALVVSAIVLWRGRLAGHSMAVSVVESPTALHYSLRVSAGGVEQVAAAVVEYFYSSQHAQDGPAGAISADSHCKSEVCRSRRYHEEGRKAAKLDKCKWRLVEDCENMFDTDQIKSCGHHLRRRRHHLWGNFKKPGKILSLVWAVLSSQRQVGQGKHCPL
ncbi:uncharacterized protein LOC118762070 [Octopus sinensis]|uniref:Uncharacterized protein LOC118762070 n=1 Tax=Octopus sinensis TaxID=2607531 RepID=A0A7E6ELN7_9MOLL|nr:uncharacterized protein LOC118762070 [Octopus sinensis]